MLLSELVDDVVVHLGHALVEPCEMFDLADPHFHDCVTLVAEIVGSVAPVRQFNAELSKRLSDVAKVAGILDVERLLGDLLQGAR